MVENASSLHSQGRGQDFAYDERVLSAYSPQKVDINLEELHGGFALTFRFVTGLIPQLQQILKSEDIFVKILADADIPAIVFPPVQIQCIGART